MTIDLGLQTIESVMDELVSRLAGTSDTPGLDAQVLLAQVLGRPRSWLLAHQEEVLPGHRLSALEKLAGRLEKGEPLPYVLGRWEFFGLEFEVSKDVLIPRPETELLAERAIAWLQAHPAFTHAADIGAGSGCISIVLAANVPALQVSSTDISPQAIDLARRNADRHGVAERVKFFQRDLFPPEGEYNLIISNPPYIPTGTLHELPIFGREPTLALDGGEDGLDLIRRILNGAPDRLIPGGLLLMEIEASQGAAVLSLAYDSFAQAEIHMHKDLSGHERMLEIQV